MQQAFNLMAFQVPKYQWPGVPEKYISASGIVMIICSFPVHFLNDYETQKPRPEVLSAW